MVTVSGRMFRKTTNQTLLLVNIMEPVQCTQYGAQEGIGLQVRVTENNGKLYQFCFIYLFLRNSKK